MLCKAIETKHELGVEIVQRSMGSIMCSDIVVQTTEANTNELGELKANASSISGVRERISLFGGLTEREVNSVLPYFELAVFEKDDRIFEQGALPTSVFIVLSGEVRLQTTKSSGEKAHVTFLPGDCFGESAVIGIQPQMGSAEVISRSATVLELSSESLMVLAEADKDVFSVLMMNIAREVSRRLHSFFTCPDEDAELPVQRA